MLVGKEHVVDVSMDDGIHAVFVRYVADGLVSNDLVNVKPLERIGKEKLDSDRIGQVDGGEEGVKERDGVHTWDFCRVQVENKLDVLDVVVPDTLADSFFQSREPWTLWIAEEILEHGD